MTPALVSGTRNFSRLTHWAAALRGHTTWFLPAVNNAEAQVGELTGWAGDLINLWCQFVDYRASSGFAGSISDWFLAHIGSTSTNERFDELDLVCDVDAYLTYNRARPGYRPIADCVREIEVACRSDPNWRYRQFYVERFGASPGKAAKAAEHVFVSWFVGLSYPLSHFLDGRPAPTAEEAKQIGLGFEAAILSRT
ncbi:hypothetical protein [Microbacterium sp. 2RAF4]|uniref:hypothetical protein n=1 Tax=Microbacterium sp. 2RAF4 TaxID=3232999 RepID=UPI003F9C2D55